VSLPTLDTVGREVGVAWEQGVEEGGQALYLLDIVKREGVSVPTVGVRCVRSHQLGRYVRPG